MIALANTWVDVYRSTLDSGYGDTIDDNSGTPLSAGIPIALSESSRLVDRPDSDTPRIVRTVTGRVTGGTDIRAGDRLRTSAGRWLLVDAAFAAEGVALAPDLRLGLRHVTY